MKHCLRWMIACVLIALTLAVILPKFGVVTAGASLLIPFLMIGCCILPLLLMFGQRGNSKSCCTKKNGESPSSSDTKTTSDAVKSSSGSCH